MKTQFSRESCLLLRDIPDRLLQPLNCPVFTLCRLKNHAVCSAAVSYNNVNKNKFYFSAILHEFASEFISEKKKNIEISLAN